MPKKRQTPDWLRILRRIYTYIGAVGLAAFFGAYHIVPDTQNKIYFWCSMGAVVIQAICDVSFKIEKAEPLAPDLKAPKPRP